MILTEEEAKTKRCQESFGPPLTPHGHAVAVSFDPHGYGWHSGGGFAFTSSPSHCIGSACMAWRWHWPEFDAPSQDRGFCGKAGKP